MFSLIENIAVNRSTNQRGQSVFDWRENVGGYKRVIGVAFVHPTRKWLLDQTSASRGKLRLQTAFVVTSTERVLKRMVGNSQIRLGSLI